MPFSIKLDNGSRELAGVSRNATKKMKAVTVDWLDDFASSEAVTFKFHSGNEPQWSVKMAGSRDAEKSFRSCVQQPRRGEHSSPCRRARARRRRQRASHAPVPRHRTIDHREPLWDRGAQSRAAHPAIIPKK